MNRSIVEILQLIVNDISKNYSQFHESNLKKTISQFQNKVLELRKIDNEIKFVLKPFTTKQILEISNNLNINLLSPPNQKNKLIQVMSSLISQAKKENEFLKLIETFKPTKTISKSKVTAKKVIPSLSQYDKIRKTWLTIKDLKQLESELNEINMNDIRKIVEPWNIKPSGRYKIDLIAAIIRYIEKMKYISKLGT